MQLREIRIDGFGIFADTYMTGMTSGINVIYGPNEFGKTTILEFIRRILFGFPRSSLGSNPYPALSGGSYGGRLLCELDNGEEISVHRTRGTHGGAVTIQIDSQDLSGQEELNRLMGHISRTFYENVYGLSLDELQAVKSLDTEEVRTRIYGAGLGLGDVSLSEVKKGFKELGDSLYSPRGRIQAIPLTHDEIIQLERGIREIQRGLGEYDNLVTQRDELLEEINGIEETLRVLQVTQRSLENKRKLYESYIDLDTAQSKLSELEELPDFTEDVLENFKKLKAELENFYLQIREKEDDLKILETKRNECIYSEKLIDLESTVISLHGLGGKYRSASNDIVSVSSKRKELAERIEAEIKKLGENWLEEIIREFELKHSDGERIRTSKAGLDEVNRKISNAKNKLELHTEDIARESLRGFAGPSFYRYAIYGVTGLGLAGILGGALFSQWWLAGFSAAFFIIGILVLLKIGKKVQLESEDPLEKKLRDNLVDVESEHKKSDEEWREFLKSIKFDEDLSPDAALEVARSIENIKSDLAALDEFDNRIQRMQETIDEVNELKNQVAVYIDKSKLGADINTNIKILSGELEQSKDIKKKKESLEEQISELTTRIDTLNESRKSKKDEIEQYISSLGASDEDDLKRKQAIVTQRNELNDKIDDCKRIIQKTVGTGEHYDEFIKSISTSTPEEIQLKLDEVQEEIDELERDRTEKNQMIGELRNKIQILSSSQDLLVKQSESELKKQRLREYSREWVKWQIAQLVLDKAISKYEQTRQPVVIKAASDIFSRITNQRYGTIVRSAESNELRIRDERGDTKGVIEMSRGTKEELYFAMRLGLIKEYEKRSESMPVIMDDILVNFDDERGPLAIQALEDFAKERQIIVLTCHKNTLAIYKEYGVKEILVT